MRAWYVVFRSLVTLFWRIMSNESVVGILSFCQHMNAGYKLLVGPKKARLDVKVALSNSFGFGGHNSSVLFAPYK